jgi:hypothetical protein
MPVDLSEEELANFELLVITGAFALTISCAFCQIFLTIQHEEKTQHSEFIRFSSLELALCY